MEFSSKQKNIFLNLARGAIREFLDRGVYLQLDEGELDGDTQVLLEDRACFVTLYKKGELRGCIGTAQANDKLYKNIIRYAVYAATEDDRFDNVGFEEIDELEIEISILSPMEELDDIGDFEIGKNGLMIRQGVNSGLLLPQVAIEWGFSKQEFLEELCLKAGLRKGEYQNLNSKIYRFSAKIVKTSS